MFTPRTYDATKTDLWSTGVLLAIFFAPLTLVLEDGWEERECDDSDEEEEDATSAISLQHYIYPKQIPPPTLRGAWVRKPIFDASKGEIGLLWSIFRTLGTPNEGSWPVSAFCPYLWIPGSEISQGFTQLKGSSSIVFKEAPRQPLSKFLPHLPSSEPSTVLSLVEGLLTYLPSSRIEAKAALVHPWFTSDGVVLLPRYYPLTERHTFSVTSSLAGYMWSDILNPLVDEEEKCLEESMTLRDEWD